MFYKENEVCEHAWRLKVQWTRQRRSAFAEKWLGNSDVSEADEKL